MLRKGDIVKVRDWDYIVEHGDYDAEKDFIYMGVECFTNGMKRYCGKPLVVREVIDDGKAFYAEHGDGWIFTPEMVVKLVEIDSTGEENER